MNTQTAITECKEYAANQQKSANKILRVLMVLGLVVFMLVYMMLLFAIKLGNSDVIGQSQIIDNVPNQLVSTVIVGALTFLSVVLGVLVSLYRFHLNEVAKTEHYIIGFMRVDAASSLEDNIRTEVIHALTDSAFRYTSTGKQTKDKNIENPIPGHPTMELTTILMNKLIDSFEFKQKKGKSEPVA